MYDSTLRSATEQRAVVELSAVDKAHIEEIRQDVGAFYSQLAAMFSTEYPARRRELAAAAGQSDFALVRQIAHRLCNSCGAVGANRLATRFHEIEIQASVGNCTNLVEQLQEADSMFDAIQDWLSRNGQE